MANPQKENGYTPIANEVLEAIICSGLNGAELSVLLYVIRKTYGYQKKEDEISLSQFLKKIPVSKPTICKALKTLQLVKILLLVKKGKHIKCANKYCFNKNYDEWQLVKKTKLVKFSKRTSKENDTKLVKKTLHTKERKENIQKKNIINNTKQSFGNSEINKLIEAIKIKTGISDFKESQKMQRFRGNHLNLLLKKIGKEEFVRRLDLILDDDFKHKNCNSLRFIYNEIKGFIEPRKNSNKGIFIS